MKKMGEMDEMKSEMGGRQWGQRETWWWWDCEGQNCIFNTCKE